jgi:mRNA interferase RelE/StbE
LAWKIEYSHTAQEQLRKLDKQTARRILDYVEERLAFRENPRDIGKALSGPLGALWRYRVGDYRLICDIQDNASRILVLRIGKRTEVYKI